MAFFSFLELVDVIIMAAMMGYIFMGIIHRRSIRDEDLLNPRKNRRKDFLFSALIVGGSVILHELGHKFTAMALGHHATFFGACSVQHFSLGGTCGFMLLAIMLKAAGFPFLFFVPAYVQFTGGTPAELALIAIMGPFMNLLLWLGPKLYMRHFSKSFQKLSSTWQIALVYLSKINMFLFIFNILPIPGFDGFHVYKNLFQILF